MKVHILFFLIVASAAKTLQSQDVSERITGASDATVGQWPFMASVHHAGTFICGGALFSLQWAITSAECVSPYLIELPLRVYIAVGGVSNAGLEPGKVDCALDQMVIHPEYYSEDQFLFNNIALLHCITPVSVSPQIQPMNLPLATEVVVPGAPAVFAGWGGDNDSYPVTNLQFVADSKIMDTGVCTTVLGIFLGDSDLCTEPSDKTTACKYDHGSPLFRIDPADGTILLGINSYAPCEATFTPTVFTNIPAYVPWISTITA